MASFACVACRVHFCDLNFQRLHYQSQWHRYNLKRSVAQLPPITLEAFQQLEAIQKQAQQTQESKSTFYCDSCCKQFGNEKAYENHTQSKKHKEFQLKKASNQSSPPKPKVENVKITNNESKKVVEEVEADDSDSNWEDVDDEEEELEGDPIPPIQCLFCSHPSENMHDNIQHMSSFHSFFIPDVDYLQDLEGLLTYLGEKVGVGLKCLWCGDSGKGFSAVKAVQQHMYDKGHCKMRYENGDSLMEYADFYDYSASYPDADTNDKDEEVHIDKIEANDDWQLVLPSGATIGHRSLLRYYKQNLKPVTENGRRTQRSVMDKVLSSYRALGWTGTTGEAAVQKAKDIKYFQRIQAKQQLKIMQKHNRILQPHFRHQTGLTGF
ncbi:zinc finger protein 622-like protein [Dinothrombium tinctorium]|uniref:Zinc finger protein 622-like protein n=1 Tax=Dinothrombium tinctorium TaxID=1965070 RepID=A0A443QX19_9ACAR|nr:zinc finger protein 622-like protein [Dinothrombium tinctorium]RWS07792.1 zinc finger protein 622-like protein [Dinothrombium tinctorium]